MTGTEQTDERAQRVAYNYGVRLLARREYSARELRDKLVSSGKVPGGDAAQAVLSALQEDGLQSDVRYTEAQLRALTSRGYGPRYILQRLQQQGIDEAMIDACDGWHDTDWGALAVAAVERRYPERNADARTWQRASRYLQRRGFEAATARRALGAMPSSYAVTDLGDDAAGEC